ncbi:MAG TPA: PrsW family intramembrane metalloprotease [Lachnoclostridium sp.]|nr:PrsW family intramembrane metalloprotease [Lachnoclostridium sp.]
MFLLPFTPLAAYIAVYVGAAVLPAIILMRYIYNQDSIEKEPGYLLKKLFVGGIWAALASILLETIGTTLLNAWIPDADSPAYKIVLAFLVVAVAEEGTKYFFLRRRSWNDPNFDFRFDGIVYAVFVSLGFAAFENISYVFSYGLGVSIPRAFLSIPGHMGFAVVMGVFYGQAKQLENRGKRGLSALYRRIGYLFAVFLHGFYDACAMLETETSTIVFIVFVIVMYIVVFRLIKKSAKHDEPTY